MSTNRPIKILHVVGAMNRAGTETMLMNIFRYMKHEGITFDFISYSQEEAHYDREIMEMGGRIIRLTKTNSVKAIYETIKHYGPYDAVHAHTLFHCGVALLAALLAGVKIRIAHAHTTSDDTSTLARKVYTTIMRPLINALSTQALACSEQAGRYLFGAKKVQKSDYTYFPNVIEYEKFLSKPEASVNRFKMEAGCGKNLIIGHIGRFIAAKNHEFLLDVMKYAVKKEPAIQLLLVGDGDLRAQIEAKARSEGLTDNIYFAGIREDVAAMLHSMDVFVFPSLYEGLGLVLLEAQACGVPALVSEAIQPEADLRVGLVSRKKLSDGPKAWADEIIELSSQKETNTSKIKAGFETNGYSLPKAINALIRLYNPETGGAYERHIDHLF
ncbi:glycosyltransferase EpsF [Lentibacillus persicus]|uniref:Glycosyltransferase EpsF n=1 Tax=Lentibacillus persicus TaxID=640948 RepID=A0A1I1U8Z6_9BACI|nr:glycosyltransferase family 1 protein [Lentibacillus persicus]SFD67144.1 glycosyltransferase EpsF [Lentibacillus persicus]